MCKVTFLSFIDESLIDRTLRSNKHSSFATTFPIYLFTQRVEEVPIEEPESEVEETTETAAEPAESETATPETMSEDEDEEVTVEDAAEEVKAEEVEDEEPVVKTQPVIVDEWVHLNSQPPIWMR